MDDIPEVLPDWIEELPPDPRWPSERRYRSSFMLKLYRIDRTPYRGRWMAWDMRGDRVLCSHPHPERLIEEMERRGIAHYFLDNEIEPGEDYPDDGRGFWPP